MFRYLGEPRNILAEPLGSAEPRLKNTALDYEIHFLDVCCKRRQQQQRRYNVVRSSVESVYKKGHRDAHKTNRTDDGKSRRNFEKFDSQQFD
jgi:hypothetical protein